MSNDSGSLNSCHVCHSKQVEPIPGFAELHQVTSDSKPWPQGGWLGACKLCGCVQKSIDERWLAEIETIYEQYSIYYQGLGAEQPVFSDGSATARSARLVQCLDEGGWLASTGRVLDIGCGNGAFLHAFSQKRSGWSLAGTEINEKYKQTVEQIPGVEQLYTTDVDQVPGTFDLITMIHVLEHIPDPEPFLRRLQNKLTPKGRLFIEVPTFTRNPFDLLIADHSTYFTPASLSGLLQRAGFSVDEMPSNWVPKELSLIAHRGEPIVNNPIPSEFEPVMKAISWLKTVVSSARQCAQDQQLGLFGTSIAATWLYSEVGACISFFVDEDPSRIGRTHMGYPIYHPNELKQGSIVFIPMPFIQAEQLRLRLSKTRPDLIFCTAPSL